MAPTSFQGPSRGDKAKRMENSQSVQSNVASPTYSTVENLLQNKGNAVFTISPSDTLHDAVKVLKEKRIGALLVTNDAGKLVGILSERDVVRKLADTPGQTLPQSVDENMTRNVQPCHEGDSLDSVLKRMTEGRFRHMPVLQNDNIIGMITIGDVVHYRINELEHETLQLKQMVVG